MSALRFVVALTGALGLVLVATALPAAAGEAAEPVPVCAAPEPACAPVQPCCEPCIRYVAHRLCRKVCCCCTPPKQIVLQVQDPCCCDRVVQIPVCVPGCCGDDPCVTSRCGLLCRGVVKYEWCCGFRVRVVFRHCGDIVVHTYGS